MNATFTALFDACLALGWTSTASKKGGVVLHGPDGKFIPTAEPKTADEDDAKALRSAMRRHGIGTVLADDIKVPVSISEFLPAPSPAAALATLGPSPYELAHGINAAVEMVEVVAEEVGALRKLIDGLVESRDALTRATSELRGICYNVRDDLRKLSASLEEHRPGHLTADDLSKSHAHCVTAAELKQVSDALDLALAEQLAAVNPLAALRAKMRGEAS